MNLISQMIRFILSTLIFRTFGACPNGFRKSKEGKCLETTICYPGEGYRLGDGSMTNPKDTCYKCRSGTYNRGIIDTAKMAEFDDPPDVCDPIDCSCHDGIIFVNDDTCQKGEEGKICICDREHLFYGTDSLACQFMKDQSIISRRKRPGNELTNSEKICRVIGKVTKQREVIDDLSRMGDDDPNIPLRGNPIPEREPAEFSRVGESEANQTSRSVNDFMESSRLSSINSMQSDHDSRTSGSEEFSEQNEQTSLKAIQNSSFKNSNSNIGHNRPVATVLPRVRQSFQEEQETGQIIASPVQDDEVRLALGVNTFTLPFNYRAQPDSGIADDEESSTRSNVTRRYVYEH